MIFEQHHMLRRPQDGKAHLIRPARNLRNEVRMRRPSYADRKTNFHAAPAFLLLGTGASMLWCVLVSISHGHTVPASVIRVSQTAGKVICLPATFGGVRLHPEIVCWMHPPATHRIICSGVRVIGQGSIAADATVSGSGAA